MLDLILLSLVWSGFSIEIELSTVFFHYFKYLFQSYSF